MAEVQPLDWETGNAEITALSLHRAALLVSGEETDGHRFERQIAVIAERMPGPPALARIAALFGLDETACACLEMIALADQAPVRSAALQKHDLASGGRATLALLCDILGSQAEEAMAPGAPLLASGLVEAGTEGRVFERPLSLCRPALELMQGRVAFDPVWADASRAPRAGDDGALDRGFVERFGSAVQSLMGEARPQRFHAVPEDAEQIEAACGMVGAALSIPVRVIALDDMPMDPREQAMAIRALRRDCLLTGFLPILQGDSAVWRVAATLPCATVVISESKGDAVRLVPPKDRRDAGAVWADLLGEEGFVSLEAAEVAQAFALSPAQARRAATALACGLAPDLWQAAQAEAAGDMGGLAQPVTQPTDWNDLVLPRPQQMALEQMAGFLRRRALVNETWGFSEKSPRGLGMAALFYGDSGTGKTSAAEALISRVQGETAGTLRLYRVNVAALVSKYIGETSKNFRTVFEAGAASGAALLFDEAEGLFGRRSSQGRDTLDKHSNAELGFLLQCLESYPGIAILTTNLRSAIDDAFFRRFRFAIDFPFPDRAHRALIWQRVLPPALPKGALDFEALSALSLSGGSIRSVALNGAYMAAGEGGRLEMRHLAQAARLEFAKLEKPSPERELARWLL
ncbi:ATP-binding protein [Pacificoceanicola onchidii]|uniref:ATP-binding protein n=1 Tax=Pacificoceanicola onchidii TaxID=2562685 RepID=UPI0010A30CC1|nr:ATP-binding protein [Pacificoceanicola onchidii]